MSREFIRCSAYTIRQDNRTWAFPPHFFVPFSTLTVKVTPLSSSWICWRLFPFVSGNTNTAKRILRVQNPANIQKIAYIPLNISLRLLENLVRMKVKTQQTKTVILEALALTFEANISPITAHGRGPQPEQYVHMKRMSATTGNQDIRTTTSSACCTSFR